jgi:putative ABC transport system permease protein
MLKNYLTIALRNLKKHKAFSMINILGLTIGMVVCIMIFFFVQYELSYDKFHKNYERIYRFEYNNKMFTGDSHTGLLCPAVLALALKKDYPEVEVVTRILDPSWFQPKVLMKYGGKQFYEESYLCVEPSFFEMFNFDFVKGNSKNALTNPNSIVLNEELAKKYFGNIDPVGKVLTVDGKDLSVTGVIKNVPQNSHMQFRFLTAVKFDSRFGEETSWNNNWNYHTYIRLKENISPENLRKEIFGLPGRNSERNKTINLELRPMKDIHLYAHSKNELATNGNAENIYIFSSLAFLVLIIACINFMNLSTARSSKRAAEVGLRKVIGANRSQIIRQFLSESIILSVISFFLAIIIISISLPFFNKYAEIKIEYGDLFRWSILLGLLVIIIFTGLIAGSYPAFYLSSFQPITALKKSAHFLGKRNTPLVFRKVLVVFQFVITSVLIIGMLIILKQLQYIKNKELGYSKEQILVLPSNDYKSLNNYKVLKNEFLQNPSVISATLTSDVPSDISSRRNFFAENLSQNLICGSVTIDKDFFSTFNIKFIDGRTVTERSSNDETEQFIINETAAKELNLSLPVGTKMGRGSEIQGEIVGVVKDFHFKSLHEKIGPLVMHLNGNPPKYLSLKLKTENLDAVMNFIKKKFYSVFQDRPFDYYFFDDAFDKMYRKEERFASIIEVFSLLSIFVSCLGLFGLISFAVESRTKEIGIRKVLGAEIKNIFHLLTKEFAILVFTANIIAIPIAYYVLDKWLNAFAYRTKMNWWLFILSVSISCLLAIVTVGYQVIKATIANPIEALRYE